MRARQTGLGQLSSVAVFKRLRASEQWLRWLAEQLRGSTMGGLPSLGRRVLAVDATTICEPGSTGTDWRLHYALNLRDLQCDYFELSDVRGGESWRRFPVQAGDVLLGDRVYATPAGVSHVVQKGGDVVTRMKFQGVPLRDEKGRPVSLLRRAGRSRVGQAHESWAAMAVSEDDPVVGRLIIVKRSREATRAARRRLEREASRKQKKALPGELESRSILLSLEHSGRASRGQHVIGAVSFSLANRIVVQATENDFESGASAQEGPGERTRVAARQSVRGTAGGEGRRGRRFVFPLGIPPGTAAGVTGGKPSFSVVKFAPPSGRRWAYDTHSSAGPRLQRVWPTVNASARGSSIKLTHMGSHPYPWLVVTGGLQGTESAGRMPPTTWTVSPVSCGRARGPAPTFHGGPPASS